MHYENQQKIIERMSPRASISNRRNWIWQLKHCIQDISTFERLTGIKFEEKDRELIEKIAAKYPLSIIPYCLSLIEYDERITGI